MLEEQQSIFLGLPKKNYPRKLPKKLPKNVLDSIQVSGSERRVLLELPSLSILSGYRMRVRASVIAACVALGDECLNLFLINCC
jgi:hypothetical protein